jgi:hypothetical protein
MYNKSDVIMATEKFWRIVGYDSSTEIFQKLVPVGRMSQNQMKETLRVLAAKAGLTCDEVVDCYMKKNAKGYRTLLDVQVDSGPKFSMSCGSNPYFIASVVEK